METIMEHINRYIEILNKMSSMIITNETTDHYEATIRYAKLAIKDLKDFYNSNENTLNNIEKKILSKLLRDYHKVITYCYKYMKNPNLRKEVYFGL